MFSGPGSKRHSRHFCSMGKHRGGLEPPPYSYDTGRCMMDLRKGREIEKNRGSKANVILQFNFIHYILMLGATCWSYHVLLQVFAPIH